MEPVNLSESSYIFDRCCQNLGCLCQQFFTRTAKLGNSLPIKCFSLSYDLNGFKSRINRRLSTADSF